MNDNRNTQAFPRAELGTDNLPLYPGLTKREVAAIAAMQGLLSHPAIKPFGLEFNPGAIAFRALLMADELFKELGDNP